MMNYSRSGSVCGFTGVGWSILIVGFLGSCSSGDGESGPEEPLIEALKAQDQEMIQSEIFVKLYRASFEIEKEWLTPGARKKRQAALDEKVRDFKPFDPQSRYEVTERVPKGDDRVEISLLKRFRMRHLSDGAATYKDEERREKHVMAREGERWLIVSSSRECGMCDGKGTCRHCKGEGKSTAGGVSFTCPSCDGSRACSSCKGEKFRESRVSRVSMPLTIVEGDRPLKTDRSTPQAVSESFVSVKLRVKDATGRIWKKFMENLVAHLKKYYHSSVVREAEKELASAVARGCERGAKWDAAVKEIRSIGPDSAQAILELPGQVISASNEGQEVKDRRDFKRLILKKVGAEWLVDSVQDRCFGCKGTGKTSAGGRKCASCEGEGYREPITLF